MKLNKGIPVTVGTIHGTIFGGPFKEYQPNTRRLVGIKMAKEITHPHEAKVDTADYSIPALSDMQNGIIYGLKELANGNDIYVGCMGGIGRTGLFMGCMAKVMSDYMKKAHPRSTYVGVDPVMFVRNNYIPHAIETKEQMAFVREFDTTPVLAWVKTHEDAKVVTKTVHNKVVEYRDVPVYLGPFDWLMHKVFGRTP